MSDRWNNKMTIVYDGPMSVYPLLPPITIYRAVINGPTVGNQAGVWFVAANGIVVQHSLS